MQITNVIVLLEPSERRNISRLSMADTNKRCKFTKFEPDYWTSIFWCITTEIIRFVCFLSSFQETKKGQRKVIATGSFDLDNYITSDEEHSFEITVTLISSNKNILTGSIEFQLTSVMLEDGVP